MEAPFDDIIDLGSSLTLEMDTDRVEVAFQARPEEVIPDTEKRLTAKGNVSTNQMTQTVRNHIYQDYVCSCVLRIARELFALLPVGQVLIHVEEGFWTRRLDKNRERPFCPYGSPDQSWLKFTLKASTAATVSLPFHIR